ncbi:ABC transporter substrate-binding protein [Devosia rhodophyticola]|uniref:ABC transporter substrate-binding protein n=1 Tax=Devosia rhodophyticola TaxID=3026423 RepID=A0ABY7YYJ1_9HYPH|nr:ABC transporter substrate-binding protein [Devosia rhodophyticola]WDR06316.1 ABC transporter substrate-binding protein [Devosia rhodophyticola]
MNFMRRLAAPAFVLAALFAGPSFAQAFSVTDIAGREIKFDKPVKRIILGEGRMIYAIASVTEGDPFAKIVGWRNDLWTTDVTSFDQYAAKFPEVRNLPFLGNITDGTLQTEAVVALHPDLLLLPIGAKGAADEIKLQDTLDGIGVKIVYVDFREHILANTEPSLEILGKIFGEHDRAEAVAKFRREQLARITDVIAASNPPRPDVFMYRAAGLIECCGTFGPDNFGLMVDMAGGNNLGSQFLPGYTGSINPEQVIASNPDVVVVTGSDWTHVANGKSYVSVGPGTASSADASRAALKALIDVPAFTGSKALKTNNVHAIWHQFYNSPYHFVAVQQLAKWFHPELFADLDPEATFKAFSEEFLPIDFKPGYWVSLDDGN